MIRRPQEQQRHRGLPRKAESFGQDQRDLLVLIDQRTLDYVDGQCAQQGKPDRGFFELVGLGVFEDLVLVQIAVNMQFCHFPFRIEIAFRRGSKFRVHRARDIGHQALYLDCRLRVLALEPLSRVVGCLRDQLLEEMPGDILAMTQLFDENRISLGPFDHVQNAEIREARSIVLCD